MFGFSDETYIDIASGNGGNGCVSFRREKFVEKGGPDGGDGGKGGDLVFVVKSNLRTLAHLKIIRTFRAENGKNGSGARCYGRNGNDMEIPVPPGTVIKDAHTGEIIKDLTGIDRFVFLKGGRGGLGNYHFRTATRQAPKFAQPGEPGIEMRVGLELLVIADIEPGGLRCSCGKNGCLEAYSSPRRIEETLGVSLEDFFRGVEQHNPEYEALLYDMLRHLAIAVNSVHMILDCDVILGGLFSEYLQPYLPVIRDYVRAGNPFTADADFVKLSTLRHHITPLGAALYFVRDFVSGVS